VEVGEVDPAVAAGLAVPAGGWGTLTPASPVMLHTLSTPIYNYQLSGERNINIVITNLQLSTFRKEKKKLLTNTVDVILFQTD
jgi:hypothetical protein